MDKIGRAQCEAWNTWLKSDKGIGCTAGEVHGSYLENRLWWAFMAGFEAAVAVLRGKEEQ